MDLIERAQKKARESRLKPAELALKAGVSERWLYLLLQGTLKDPSYKRLKAVIEASK